MSASGIRILNLHSAAGVRFAGDQPIANLPRFGTFSEKLATVYGFDQILPSSSVPSGASGWMAVAGVVGESPLINIGNAQGNDLYLAVNVDGNSDVAERALGHVWKTLVRIAREDYPDAYPDASDDIQSLGRREDATTAVVELPLTFNALFPSFARMCEAAQQHLGRDGVVAPQPQVALTLQYMVGGALATGVITIAPRHGETPESRIVFSNSPLPSDVHLKMLEQICRDAEGSSHGE